MSVGCSSRVLALALIACSLSGGVVADDRFTELSEQRAASKDGVIDFNDGLFQQYVIGSGRTYHLAIFLTAYQMLDNPELALKVARQEFGLASKAFRDSAEAQELFFVQLAFEDAKSAFQAMGITGLPFMYHIAPDMRLSMTKFSVPKAARMDLQTTRAKYPWSAESYIDFLSGRTNFKAVPIVRPSLLRHPMFPVLVLASGTGFLGAAYQLYRSEFMRQPAIWAVGSLVIFWFSTSGAMFNIIRGMPMTMMSREGVVTYFLNQRSAQLGAEGFIMGGTYILFSLFISFLTYGVPLVKDRPARQVLGVLAVAGAGYTVYKIFEVYMWKSGYQFVPYF